MRADVIQMVADWLADGDSGVNALLPLVPTSESTPADVTIADETRDGWVARGDVPRAESLAGPFIAVFINDKIRFEWNEDTNAQPYMTAPVSLGFAYYAPNVNSEEGNLDEAVTMRALHNSLVLLNHQQNHAAREKNKVRIDRMVSLEDSPPTENKEDKIIAGGTTARFDCTAIIITPVEG